MVEGIYVKNVMQDKLENTVKKYLMVRQSVDDVKNLLTERVITVLNVYGYSALI